MQAMIIINGIFTKRTDRFEGVLNNPAEYSVGRFNPKDLDVGTGMVGAPACGDVMKLQIKCEQHGNKVLLKMLSLKHMDAAVL